MKLRAADHMLVRMAQTLAPCWRQLGDLETEMLGRRLASIRIDRPVFITGLARSGTTVLLEILAGLDGVATHRYRDFPFLWAPWGWNRVQRAMAKADTPVERPHKDRIYITRDSPEAFEEPIWQHFLPHLHDPNAIHVLTGDEQNDKFETFFKDHIRKIILLRKGRRYVSKGNYNVTRIAYLARMFPDARFIVPIRDPVTHVVSLLRQHRQFLDYAATDPRVAGYLRAAGHYEFGPQRTPVNVTETGRRQVTQAWADGDDTGGYAHLWSEIYGYVSHLLDTGDLSARVRTIRYEDFCADPAAVMDGLLDFTGLAPADGTALADRLDHISAPPPTDASTTAEERYRIREIVADVAGRFGYGCGTSGRTVRPATTPSPPDTFSANAAR